MKTQEEKTAMIEQLKIMKRGIPELQKDKYNFIVDVHIRCLNGEDVDLGAEVLEMTDDEDEGLMLISDLSHADLWLSGLSNDSDLIDETWLEEGKKFKL